MPTPAQIAMWNKAMLLPDLPPERVGQIMRQIGRRVAVVEQLKRLGSAPLIPDGDGGSQV